jgi:hypothetical protein
MRQRFIQDRETGELIPASEYHATRVKTHFVMGDLPDYESPIDGKVVHGRKGRREDFRRTNTRPWEGMAEERKESARRKHYEDARQDAGIESAARRAYAQLSPQQRRMLERL